ncbi:mechanosensitive ion channel domain-containing protein [Schlesneria sp. T3-172]|uniref:mechanosensitive ion channel domain-containing protein n=1 Tax=Schlesneria sphaerica TaxID=3373610 RepID=UPI0037CA3728
MAWRISMIVGICTLLCGSAAMAQTAPKAEKVTISNIQKRIKEIEANLNPADATQQKTLEYLKEAAERLEIAQENSQKAKDYEQSLRQVGEQARLTAERLADLPKGPDPEIADVDDLAVLDKMVEQRTKQLDDTSDGLRERVARLEAESKLRRVRPEELVNEIAAVEDRFREIDEEIKSLDTSNDPRELLQARLIFLRARHQRAETEHRALLAEAAWYQSAEAAELLQLQRELGIRELSVKLAELEILKKEQAKRRGNEADERVRLAEQALQNVIPELKTLAEENLGFARERHDITDKLVDLDHRQKASNALLGELEKEFDRTQKMVNDVGLTDSIGLLLRQQRARLQNPRGMKSSLLHRNDVIREARMRLFQLDAEHAALIDLDSAIAKRAAELLVTGKRKTALAGLKQLLSDRRQLVNGLDADYTRYFQQLVDMDNVERRLLNLTTRYADYVDERVLWIRTGQTFGSEHVKKAATSMGWLTDPAAWQPVLEAVRMNMERTPLVWILATLLFLTWFCTRPVMQILLKRKGVVAKAAGCHDLAPTLQSLALTLAIACGWPLLLLFTGWQLDHTASQYPFVHAVAAGLIRAAVFALPLEILRIVCMRGGLGQEHFNWPERYVNTWRRHLTWFIPLGVVLIALIGMTESMANEQRLDTFGRFVFLTFAAVSTIFCRLTVRRIPAFAITDDSVDEPATEEDPWSERFWQFAPSLMLLASFVLLGLGWTGFFYTATQLMWRLQRTMWFLVGLLLLRATLRRWIALEQRRMAALQGVDPTEMSEPGRPQGGASTHGSLFSRWNWPDFRLNLTQIVTQMRSLLDTGLIALLVVGLWIVWADVTPALNILDQYVLWNTSVEVMALENDSQVGSPGKTVKQMLPVTAADLCLAMVVFFIAQLAGRNVPGLVEVVLHQHLAVDAGARFAVTCLVRYTIFVVGVCMAFAQIRIGWNNVQWLVAAASVGLGFGLQEIFANFVSGIILLFERPMRVGDVITVGDTTGKVSRIQIRATTILDGDRKELIVPNKEFITGKVLNWTLSDQVNRIAIRVIVGPHNDPARITRILLDVADKHPSLLKDPAPFATLDEINGNLTFVLRAFLPQLDGRLLIISELYTAIQSRFAEENIEMVQTRHEVFVRTDERESHPSPPPPHQPLSGVSLKGW